MTGPHSPNISNKYMVTIRNKLDSLQETSKRHILNDEYENFVITEIEAAATKQRDKCRLP